MDRRALIVGIDTYEHGPPLTACVRDARAMAELLERNEDGSPNYACRVLVSDTQPVTRASLRTAWGELFERFTGEILFYFSGHGSAHNLLTQDATAEEPGLRMDDLLNLANKAKAREVLVILDCCSSGTFGNPENLQPSAGQPGATQLREGVTVLTASLANQSALETADGHGIFTWLVLNALRGGAADIRGAVSAASVYAYVEQALGPWDQRPLYKSHADRLSPIRQCAPAVPDDLLRKLPTYFDSPDCRYPLDPTYEATHSSADPNHTTVYQDFTRYRDAGLLRAVGGGHLYYTAVDSGSVELTEVGKLYWLLAKKRRI